MDKRIEGISCEQYHRMDGISASCFSHLDRSIDHLNAYFNEKYAETPALLDGRAIHHYVLEHDTFDEAFATAPDVDRRTKAGKEAFAEFQAEAGGRTVIKADTLVTCQRIHKAIMDHPGARNLVGKATALEVSYFDPDPETGILCKCRPDAELPAPILIDLKTTSDASESKFSRDAFKFNYHRQAAFYLDLVSRVRSEEYNGFAVVAVEKQEPYAVQVFVLDRAAIDAGREQYRAGLRKYYKYQQNPKQWTGLGHPVEPTPIYLPDWMK